MKKVLFGSVATLAALTLSVACGGGGTGASGGSGGSGGAGGSGGSGGGGQAGTTITKSGDITANETWTKENQYVLEGTVFVAPGAELTIEAGTVISGTQSPSLGTLVVSPGAKIHAVGTADEPIVFTSLAPAGSRLAGDWGGLIVLGKAPINVPGGTASVEGLEVGPKTQYGGSDPDDDSGELSYVRIEFSGGELSTDNEINGLTLGGVGAGTQIDHVMVHETLDDCFEFFGGTVNAKYLICADNGDDGFDWDFGYSGKLQFLALKQDPTVADTANGFEGDNDADGSLNTPVSEPEIYNVTLCGQNTTLDKQQFGMLIRRSSKAHVFNAIVTGFEAGVDFRNAVDGVEVSNSLFFGNLEANVAYAETDTDPANKDLPTYDDDAGYDEAAELLAAGNAETNPMLGGCFAATPDFLPAATLSAGAATPPDDGFFDATASYIGAFKAGDAWATGAWVSFAQD